MKKAYKKLTTTQKARGVIFSSCLRTQKYELQDDTIHEVFKDTADRDTVIERLLNDKFFNSSHWNYNIIRRD